ncbi:MAG: hypothetical protein WBP81_32990 [Solirubrobacteraceae bacterium]
MNTTTLRRMDGAWLARMRWRRRGAWLWPVFVAVTVLDAVIGHLLPPAGETQTVFAAAMLGLIANLVAVLLLSRPLGAVLRRVRPDLPAVVARNYAGTGAVVFVAIVLLTVGLAHRSSIVSERRAMQDAIVRAQAYIGDRAPAQFRRDIQLTSTYAIEPGAIYRVCVPSVNRKRTYCVVVKTHLPFERSVTFAGYEPNSMFSIGMG